MKSILFVDDEPNVLDGLRRMLRPMRAEWDMSFARSGHEALEVLAAKRFDVIVSDMRMPGMDGAELLTEVRRRYPNVVRIALSGHSQKEMILRSVGPTHQYLAKPCDAQTLKDTITRACALRDLLADEALQGLVSQLTTLPSLPDLYIEIVEELQREDASIQKVGRIISKDVGMTAKVLQLVNSAFFGLRRHVSDPSQAVCLLGLETIKALVLSIHVFSKLEQANVAGFSLQRLWEHSMVTGTLAKRIAAEQDSDEKTADHALMAGLLHDAGKLVLAANLPEQYGKVLALAEMKAVSQGEAEKEVFGTTHAEVGAYLLGLWGLPGPIVEAIAFHHRPTESLANSFAPLTAVHVANALEHAQQNDGQADRLDGEYLSVVGLADQLPAWREMAGKLAHTGEQS